MALDAFFLTNVLLYLRQRVEEPTNAYNFKYFSMILSLILQPEKQNSGALFSRPSAAKADHSFVLEDKISDNKVFFSLFDF